MPTQHRKLNRGHLSEPFEITTGIRQGDGLSPLLLNLILDKVLQTFWEGSEAGIPIGGKKARLKVKCLAFADDIAFMVETEEEAIRQIEELKEISKIDGLQISYK